MATWSGIVYVAFVIDVFFRTIADWSAAASKRAKLVLDALDMTSWLRARVGNPAGLGLIHHFDAGSQYTSFAFTAHLLEAGIDASIGTAGDALDNALMESRTGLYKTELIKPRKPWHGLPDIELATAEWVDWFNNQRLHTATGPSHSTNTRPTTTLNTSPNRWPEPTHRASTDPEALHCVPAPQHLTASQSLPGAPLSTSEAGKAVCFRPSPRGREARDGQGVGG